MDTDLMKPTEVADYLKIGRALTYTLLKQGQIPSVRIGKTVRVKMADLEKFILEHIEYGERTEVFRIMSVLFQTMELTVTICRKVDSTLTVE